MSDRLSLIELTLSIAARTTEATKIAESVLYNLIGEGGGGSPSDEKANNAIEPTLLRMGERLDVLLSLLHRTEIVLLGSVGQSKPDKPRRANG